MMKEQKKIDDGDDKDRDEKKETPKTLIKINRRRIKKNKYLENI